MFKAIEIPGSDQQQRVSFLGLNKRITIHNLCKWPVPPQQWFLNEINQLKYLKWYYIIQRYKSATDKRNDCGADWYGFWVRSDMRNSPNAHRKESMSACSAARRPPSASKQAGFIGVDYKNSKYNAELDYIFRRGHQISLGSIATFP